MVRKLNVSTKYVLYHNIFILFITLDNKTQRAGTIRRIKVGILFLYPDAPDSNPIENEMKSHDGDFFHALDNSVDGTI